ncbi:cAMP-responsive element modulator isoform 20-T25 [Molossus nigricans]|uniref:cAMP-responsive element modulator isoform X13 n=1 Tax=Molossus molossus TaxID=27622 RepID=UPI001746CE67|nr:cAMP-responsive element modulator isoform X13 [Molossus molossus]
MNFPLMCLVFPRLKKKNQREKERHLKSLPWQYRLAYIRLARGNTVCLGLATHSEVTNEDEETELAPSHMAAATGDMPTYQIRAPTTALPQGVVMAASPGSLHSHQQLAEEATRKRELRLMKNREAARECRRKKKEYVKCLENRVAVLENQNKTLIEELKALKDLYCHKAE